MHAMRAVLTLGILAVVGCGEGIQPVDTGKKPTPILDSNACVLETHPGYWVPGLMVDGHCIPESPTYEER